MNRHPGSQPSHSSPWAIILSGGEGTRMRPLIKQWLGDSRPKQYCTFTGTRSMLQHTLDRAGDLVGRERMVTVIGGDHRSYLRDQFPTLPGKIIEQPQSKDTGPGVFLPLSYVMAKEPAATVYLLPSDHFIFPEEKFLRQMRQASDLVARHPDRMVLVAAEADAAETDYGWIAPGDPVDGWNADGCASPRHVAGFCEKPSAPLASKWFAEGYLWNTLILVTRADTLWSVGCSLFPAEMAKFQQFVDWLRYHKAPWTRGREKAVLAELYGELDSFNFSDQILARAAHRCLVLPLAGVMWSDWGRPNRIEQTLESIGKPLAVAMPGSAGLAATARAV